MKKGVVFFECGSTMTIPMFVEPGFDATPVLSVQSVETMDRLSETIADARLATRRLQDAGIIGAVTNPAGLVGNQASNF